MSKPSFSGQWMPWFHGDFLKSTQGWTVAERGVYFLLLGASWEVGPLPDNQRRLAGIVGAQLDEFEQAWAIVRPKFQLSDEGLTNPRLELHRARQAERSEKARQSALARWPESNERDSDTSGDAKASANGDAFDDAGRDAKPMLEGMRSGCSSDLRSQNSEKGKSSELKPLRATARAVGVSPLLLDGIKEAFRELCSELAPFRSWPEERRKKLEARIAERLAEGKAAETVEYWRAVFEKVAASDFLNGRGDTNWRATIDWVLGKKKGEVSNLTKIVDGNYDNRGRQSNNGARAYG